jgi:RNA polymerase sigma-70 factor (family 1)
MLTDKAELYERFRQVFEEYYVALCNYAFVFTKERNSSEDIVQETFLKIWEKKQDLIGNDTIRYYLFTAVRNNSLSYLKQEKKVFPLQGLDLADYDVQPMRADDTQKTEPVILIKKGLALLPPKCREVFLLSRISNLPYKEIAKSLDISVKTVENQIGKALKILKNFLREDKTRYLCWLFVCFQYLDFPPIGDLGNWLFF